MAGPTRCLRRGSPISPLTVCGGASTLLHSQESSVAAASVQAMTKLGVNRPGMSGGWIWRLSRSA